jgi:hypothetical protein
MTPEQEQEITRLRSRSLSPKQIARQLSLRPAEVTAFIQVQAQGTQLTRELSPLHHCLIDEGAAKHLLDRKSKKGKDNSRGLSQIFVTRRERNNYLVCSYLVDYWCLGVKSTFGPRKMDPRKYETIVQQSYDTFDGDYREISLVQAQSIIFGAFDYADRLGLKPDPDFERSIVQLGQRPEQLIEIEFGQNGKPMYVNGPYDNPDKIIDTLRRSVGDGNFDFVMFLGSDMDF